MKRAIWFFCGLVLFFWSCSDDSYIRISTDDDGWNLADGKTGVRFVNDNYFSVEIYSDSSRLNKLVDIDPRKKSIAIETTPNQQGAIFYPRYKLVIDDISFPYDGEAIVVRIDEGRNEAKVHLLSELSEDEKNNPISTDTYIGIKNNSSYTLSLRQGNTEVHLEGSTSPLLNTNESGTFRITPGPVSGYSLMRNATTAVDFPSTITEFVSARLYSFRFDGSLVLSGAKALTIAEALASVRTTDGTTGGTTDNGNTGSFGEQILTFNSTKREYRFVYNITQSGKTFFVETRGNLDTILYLYNSAGQYITGDDDSGSGYNASLSVNLNPGTYYVVVEPYEYATVGSCTLYAELK